jgi:hypothetical protein
MGGQNLDCMEFESWLKHQRRGLTWLKQRYDLMEFPSCDLFESQYFIEKT